MINLFLNKIDSRLKKRTDDLKSTDKIHGKSDNKIYQEENNRNDKNNKHEKNSHDFNDSESDNLEYDEYTNVSNNREIKGNYIDTKK